MDKIEQAKKILKKAIALDDAELMAIANEMLGLDDDTSWEPLHKKPEPVIEAPKDTPIPEVVNASPKIIRGRDMDFSEFKMTTDDDMSRKNGIPVNKIKRDIQFLDDGSDRDIKTPDVARTERKRAPFKKIDQQCAKCGRTVQTNPAHKREYFVCDGCIRK